MSSVIALMDSGAGGLPYLERTRQLVPSAHYCYIADPGNFPYGEKTPDQLRDILVANTERVLNSFNPDVVVLACNTASVVALETLRSRFSVPFVGVVPAVKPAAALSRNGRVGILATKETVGNPYTQNLIDVFAAESVVFRYAGVDIVELVEKQFFSIPEPEKRVILEKAVVFFKEKAVDTVVLGCTHFIHLKNELSSLLGVDVTVIDSVEGVARQIQRIMMSVRFGTHLPVLQKDSLFIASGSNNQPVLRQFASCYGLEYCGALK